MIRSAIRTGLISFICVFFLAASPVFEANGESHKLMKEVGADELLNIMAEFRKNLFEDDCRDIRISVRSKNNGSSKFVVWAVCLEFREKKKEMEGRAP